MYVHCFSSFFSFSISALDASLHGSLSNCNSELCQIRSDIILVRAELHRVQIEKQTMERKKEKDINIIKDMEKNKRETMEEKIKRKEKIIEEMQKERKSMQVCEQFPTQ